MSLDAASRTGFDAVATIARGETTVTSVVDAALERVHALEESLHAFRVIDEAAVLDRAKQLDDGQHSPSAGFVVGVKDVIDTVDLPTEYGSPLFAGHQPAEDADAVARLRTAGAVLMGKTESTEFAMFQPTRTRNPHDHSRTPGGSSSGSAAAVAAGMVHGALGTQTAGSVIRPAAYCGVYGFKPSRGWSSTRGIWQLAESLDTLGLFARSVTDLHMLHAALRDQPTPPAGRLPSRPAGRPRAVVLSGAEWAAADPVVEEALEYVSSALVAAGWVVAPMAMPSVWAELPERHKTVMAVEVARNLRSRLGPRIEKISASARTVVEAGDRTAAMAYVDALAARDEALRMAAGLAATADLALMPSALGVAPQGLDFTGDPVMCRPWTLLGLPAANVPAYLAGGLPVGVQCAGLVANDDLFLLHLASVEDAITEQERCE